jgi:hypothetical protein
MKTVPRPLIGGLVVAAAMLMFAVVSFSFTSTQPKITWSPSHFDITLCRGGTSTLVATFTSDQPLQNVVLEPQVPVIAKYITVQPSALPSVPAGQPQTIYISFNVPANLPAAIFNGATYQGIIYLHIGKGIAPQRVSVSLTLAATCSQAAKITWSSSAVYASVTATTSVSKTLTFTSDQTLQNITVEAVPAIAGFVKIQPATFANVPAKQPQTVQLTFKAPSGAQFGSYDGTIHVRAGSKTLPQPLTTSVTFAVVPLPPDPGEAGKVTLQGIDADGDGVRDDVERYIALTYATSTKTRYGLTQYAKAQQQLLVQATNKQSTIQNATDTGRADHCLKSIAGFNIAVSIRDDLGSLMLNTYDRVGANTRAESQLGGQVMEGMPPSQWRAQCDFNPDVLPN